MPERQAKDCHPLLAPLKPLVAFLKAVVGPDYEIVLHDVSGPERFIVAMANGNITGRGPDAPLTDFGDYILSSDRYDDTDYIANYPSSAPDGKPLRSSVAIIRDPGRRIVGLLCVNYDAGRAAVIKDLADFLTATAPLDAPEAEPEHFAPRQDERLRSVLDEIKRGRRGAPLSAATKQERLDLLERLDLENFFDTKGTMETVCAETGKSRFTIYGDLRNLRLARGSAR